MSDTATVGTARVLSAVEFDVVWEALGLGATPAVLNLPSPGRTHTERRRIVAGVWAGLRERGLAGAHGPEPGLRHLLRLLASPAVRIEVRAWGPAPGRAAVAGHRDDGVLARCRGDTVELEPCTSLPVAVVGVLPAAPPGPGRTANVPTAALAAALRRPSAAGLRGDLIDRRVPPAEAGPVARMLHGIDGRAQIGVAAADSWGMLRRSSEGLGVLDGPRGRYVVVRSRADGDWTTITPTDERRLRHRVSELLSRTVEAARPPDQSRSPWRMSWRPDSVIEPESEG
jgi:hypothetical protein